jgi:hypothetical protein
LRFANNEQRILTTFSDSVGRPKSTAFTTLDVSPEDRKYDALEEAPAAPRSAGDQACPNCPFFRRIFAPVLLSVEHCRLRARPARLARSRVVSAGVEI